MKLLTELLVVKKTIDRNTLEESINQLFEDMGNLKTLNLGPLVNAFKQTYNSHYRQRKGGSTHYLNVSEIGKKFRQYSGIGRDSPIIDVSGQIKTWANVRRAYKENPDSIGCAVYLNGKPVALMVMNEYQANHGNDEAGLAWDLTKAVPDKIEQEKIINALYRGADNEDRNIVIAGKQGQSGHERVMGQLVDQWHKAKALADLGIVKRDLKEVPYKDYEDWSDAVRASNSKVIINKMAGENEIVAMMGNDKVGVWDRKASNGFILMKQKPFNDMVNLSYDSPKQYQGVAQYVRQISAFIVALAEQGAVTIKLILKDVKGERVKDERRKNPALTAEDVKLFKDNIKTRLSKYKNSKLDKIEDVQGLVNRLIGGELKKVSFAGRTYIATPKTMYLGNSTRNSKSDGYKEYHDSTMNTLFSGKSVDLVYEPDEVSGYGQLTLTVRLKGGVLKPVSINYKDETDGNSGTYKTVKFED